MQLQLRRASISRCTKAYVTPRPSMCGLGGVTVGVPSAAGCGNAPTVPPPMFFCFFRSGSNVVTVERLDWMQSRWRVGVLAASRGCELWRLTHREPGAPGGRSWGGPWPQPPPAKSNTVSNLPAQLS